MIVSSNQQASRLLPGGGITALALPGGLHRVLVRGLGSRVWDTDGVEYVDYLLGSGPLILGHAHPAVVEAVQRQVSLGSTFYALNEPILRLAERIVEGVPCAEMVQFCVSGAEATFYALRLARAATGKDAILKFEGGFHGSNDYALMSLYPSGAARYPTPEPSSAGIPKALEQEVLIAPFNDLQATRQIVSEHTNRLAAIIVEPLQRVITPRPGFLQGLRELASQHRLVLIFDEIVTGFRLAPGGAQEYFDVTPDLATFGKIIGGGYPLAAVAGRREIMELADPGRRGRADFVYFSGTLNGNPVAAVAGLATLHQLDNLAVYSRLFSAGDRIRSGLTKAFASADIPAQVMGIGPIFQALLSPDPVFDYRSMKKADATRMKQIALEVFRQGFFVSGEKAYLSLAHSDEDLDRTVEAFARAIEVVAAQPT